MDPYVALSCFGNRQLTFEARIGGFDGLTCPDTPPLRWEVEPAWLGGCSIADALAPTVGDPELTSTPVVLDPAIDRRTLPEYGENAQIWTAVEVSGAFDHPEARTCRAHAIEDSLPPPRPEAVVLTCRSQFVVSSIRLVR